MLSVDGAADDPKLFRVVQLFSMQIFHGKVEFTAAGFFKLDYKFVTSVSGVGVKMLIEGRMILKPELSIADDLLQIMAAVATYLVIMIQLHQSTKG